MALQPKPGPEHDKPAPKPHDPVISGVEPGVDAFKVHFHKKPDAEPETLDIQSGSSFGEELPDPEIIPDALFVGWETADGTPVTGESLIGGELELYPAYIPTTAELTFKSSNEELGTVSHEAETVDLISGGEPQTVVAVVDDPNDETVFIGWSDESGEIVETNPRLTPQLAPKPEEGTRKAGPAAAPAAKKGPAAKADEKAPKLLDSIKPSPFGTERPLDAKYTANFVRMPEFHPEAKGPVHAHAGKKTFSETTEMNTEAVDTVGDVSVEAIAQEKLGEDVEVVAAYDITFTDGGAEVQPYNENPVTVTIEVGEELIGRSLTLLHISDDGVASVVEDAEFSEDGTVTFTANSFSVYVVVAEENPRVIVNFYDFDGGTTPLETMYVKKSDEDTDVDKIIFDPSEKVTVVTSGNEVFYGWATTASYTTAAVETALSIEDVRDEVKTKRDSLGTSDVTVDYYAIVCRKYSVDYLDDKNITLGSSEIRMLKTDPTSQQYTVNMVYTPGDSNHNFEGWKVSQGGTNIAGHDPAANDGQGTYYSNGTSITISGNVIFSVNAPSGQWLVYDENAPEGSKATYNAPRFLKSGDVTVDPNTADRPMTCVGYEFGGWFDSKEHADNLDSEEGRFSFGSPINDRTTVYARWSQKTKADYTIVIWKQNVNGFKKDDQGNPTTEKLYDFEEVITVKNANVQTHSSA